jgi:hypothetical protein
MDGDPNKPATSAERIAVAKNLWDCGKKNEAFHAALDAVAFISQGLHGAGQNFRVVDERHQALVKSLQELGGNDQSISSALAALALRVAAIEQRMGPQPGEEWKEGK